MKGPITSNYFHVKQESEMSEEEKSYYLDMRIKFLLEGTSYSKEEIIKRIKAFDRSKKDD